MARAGTPGVGTHACPGRLGLSTRRLACWGNPMAGLAMALPHPTPCGAVCERCVALLKPHAPAGWIRPSAQRSNACPLYVKVSPRRTFCWSANCSTTSGTIKAPAAHPPSAYKLVASGAGFLVAATIIPAVAAPDNKHPARLAPGLRLTGPVTPERPEVLHPASTAPIRAMKITARRRYKNVLIRCSIKTPGTPCAEVVFHMYTRHTRADRQALKARLSADVSEYIHIQPSQGL
jgi:hypothetical protein